MDQPDNRMSAYNTLPPICDVSAIAQTLKESGQQFAVATVVRTVSVTAAKPGAKAILNAEGEVIEGWIGGGCARHAVSRAAIKSIMDGEPRLVSIQPEELLQEQGLNAGDEHGGVLAASNMCPSQGSMDVFIEPVLCNPAVTIYGTSPVAVILAELAKPFGLNVHVRKSASDEAVPEMPAPDSIGQHYIVVATQGNGDLKALQAALTHKARYIGFVGSPKKTGHLKQKLLDAGIDESMLATIKGPAGLDLGAVTPQEIALSIVAEIIALRRAGAVATQAVTTDPN
jgi:xanthine dehydrogenase accessory factor